MVLRMTTTGQYPKDIQTRAVTNNQIIIHQSGLEVGNQVLQSTTIPRKTITLHAVRLEKIIFQRHRHIYKDLLRSEFCDKLAKEKFECGTNLDWKNCQ